MNKIPVPRRLLFVYALLASGPTMVAGSIVDTLVLGDPASESGHGFSAERSEIIQGGLGEPARRLLPREPVSHNGGSVSFTLKVDPVRQNYLTVKLWGSDRGIEQGRLILYLDGQQVGYRHEGDHDVLNQSDEEALFQGRFVYQTVALPPRLTNGRTEIPLQIRVLGRMWPYGPTFPQKQRQLTLPSRGIYRLYTHTDTRFNPEPTEGQGAAVAPTVRPAGPGAEILEQMKETVQARLTRLLAASPDAQAAGSIHLLAEAFNTPWTVAYRDPRAITALVCAGDRYLRPGVIGQPWVGAGPLGEAIARVGEQPLRQALAEEIEVPVGLPFVPEQRNLKPGEELAPGPVALPAATKRMSRREAWAQVLRASVDWNRMSGRRFYTNQSMIVDFNIYAANRGLQVIDPARALPETQARRYLYESVGLLPWLGNDLPEGGSTKPLGDRYYQITRKGLSRELGYVASYGETILTFTRDMAEFTDDEKIRAQLRKIQAGRMVFRYPSQDLDGYRQMKLASEIDNRVAHFPQSRGAYGVADVREAWWMELPAYLQDPISLGAVQQCLEDNQYFPRLAGRLNDNDTLGMMRNIADYEKVRALPASAYRLPMSDGQPDFVYADEENAVVALKHGDRRLFLNFYFRQEFGVSGVTRILEVEPRVMRIASVIAQTEVEGTGEFWVRPDVIDFQRNGGIPPPDEVIHQAWRGEKLPIARRPADATQPAYGRWGPFVGKAAFYWLRYGDYLVGLNTTEHTSYLLPVPGDAARALDLATGKTVDLRQPVQVAPLSSVVLYLGTR